MQRLIIVCLLGLFLLAGCATYQPLFKTISAENIINNMQDRADSSAVKIGNLTKENAYLKNDILQYQKVIGATNEVLNKINWKTVPDLANQFRSIGWPIPADSSATK